MHRLPPGSSKQWAVRLMHEANNTKQTPSSHSPTQTRRSLRDGPTWEPTVPYTPPSRDARLANNQTSSETHAEAHAHADSLIKRDVQLFIKRLRKEQDSRGSSKIKYYLVGEYGDLTKRPHYHAAIFGEDFADDRYAWRHQDQTPSIDRQDLKDYGLTATPKSAN